jgi:hypothetical protein
MALAGTFTPQLEYASWFDAQLYAVGWFADDLIPPSSGPFTTLQFPQKRGLTFFPG